MEIELAYDIVLVEGIGSDVDVDAQSPSRKIVNPHINLNSLKQAALEYLRVLIDSVANIGFSELIGSCFDLGSYSQLNQAQCLSLCNSIPTVI